MPVRQPYAGVDFIPQSGIYEFGHFMFPLRIWFIYNVGRGALVILHSTPRWRKLYTVSVQYVCTPPHRKDKQACTWLAGPAAGAGGPLPGAPAPACSRSADWALPPRSSAHSPAHPSPGSQHFHVNNILNPPPASHINKLHNIEHNKKFVH
jgi:hypothetical protein